jgi:hypothetical protein
MSCHVHREAVLDIARGVTQPAAVVRAAQLHVERCPSCAAELERQQRLTAALQMLADQAADWRPSGDLEGRLRAAFAASRDPGCAGESGRPAWRQWGWGLAAAAAIVTTAWLSWGSREPGAHASHVSGTAASSPPAADSPASRDGDGRLEGARQSPAAAGARHVARGGLSRNVARGRRPAVVRTMEFIAIPGSAGLPPLESATIVRTELPVSVLPIYGVDIVPAAARPAVEADLLVGQDGQARAIRLVRPDQESRESRSR